jgi:hypothetical protein
MAGDWACPSDSADSLKFSSDMVEALKDIQSSWTPEDRDHRAGRVAQDSSGWTPPQYLVHHAESGRWQKGKERKVLVWRCVDGR